MQGTWIALIGLPVWLSNALPPSRTRPWGPWDTAILAFGALSLGAEILADEQKSVWRKEQKKGKHQEKFISSGLWAWSRHPKCVPFPSFSRIHETYHLYSYVAEVGIHASISALACRSLVAPGVPGTAVGLALLSPVFTYYILRYVRFLPPHEKGDLVLILSVVERCSAFRKSCQEEMGG